MYIKMVLVIASLLMISGIASVGIIQRAAQGPADNWFNRSWRSTVAQSPTLRNWFGLDDPGDARFDYLGGRYHQITIVVSHADAAKLEDGVIRRFADTVAEITQKTVVVYETDIVDSPVIGVQLNFQVMEEDLEEPDLVGRTDGSHSIIVYKNALERFVVDSRATLANYELSTALHEFGHLLGLAHNDDEGCLMNVHAETDHRPRWDPSDVVTSFCANELSQLHN